jgi:hypothetical protein
MRSGSVDAASKKNYLRTMATLKVSNNRYFFDTATVEQRSINMVLYILKPCGDWESRQLRATLPIGLEISR